MSNICEQTTNKFVGTVYAEFESLVKPTDPFSEKEMCVIAQNIPRFIDVNKYLWGEDAINYFVVYIHYCTKSQISVRG